MSLKPQRSVIRYALLLLQVGEELHFSEAVTDIRKRIVAPAGAESSCIRQKYFYGKTTALLSCITPSDCSGIRATVAGPDIDKPSNSRACVDNSRKLLCLRNSTRDR
jgi:hypothetical protein